jgi:hypothetical protein
MSKFSNLGSVDKLGKRDVGMVPKRMKKMEFIVSAVLELEPQEITIIREG